MDVRLLVIRKMNDGWSQKMIAQDLNISRHAVQHIIKKFMEHGTTENLPKSGRPPLNTTRSVRLLVRDAKVNPKKTAPELLKDWESSVPTSVTTVKRILRKYNLFGRIAAKKPLLSKRNINNRYQWCKIYSKLQPEFWKDVIFSDESRLEIYSRRREYVRRPQGTRYEDKYTMKTVKLGGKSLMVWGAIKEDGTRILIRCPDRMNSAGYAEVLQKGLFPIYEQQNIFQQDGSPCHKSGFVSSYLDKKLICILCDWPAQSPDLNIIEPLWSYLKNRVSKCKPRNIEALWKCCEEQWAMIPDQEIKKLYESIPRRIQAVLRNKGLNTYY